MTKKDVSGAGEIARLLRVLGKAGCDVTTEAGAGNCSLSAPGGRCAIFDRATVGSALQMGLVSLNGRHLVPTAEARPFLRRFLAAREEAFLDQHRAVDVVEIVQDGASAHVRFNADNSPLASLARLKDGAGRAWFCDETLSAGVRLARDFHYANLQPKISPSYEPRLGNRVRSAPGAGVELKDSVLAARIRVGRAVDAMGPELSGVALDVCCFEKGLELVERERQWPARSAKLMLKTALQLLHRHYNPAPAAGNRPHAWGAEGYRPEMQW